MIECVPLKPSVLKFLESNDEDQVNRKKACLFNKIEFTAYEGHWLSVKRKYLAINDNRAKKLENSKIEKS